MYVADLFWFFTTVEQDSYSETLCVDFYTYCVSKTKQTKKYKKPKQNSSNKRSSFDGYDLRGDNGEQ